MWFDTHCHLSDDCFDDVRQDLINNFKATNISYVLDAATNLLDSKKCIENANQNDSVFASVGIHPDFIKDLPTDYLDQIKELSKNKKVVAIGEIGLDYHYDVDPRDYQKKRFTEMVELATQIKKPVIVHNRDAHNDTYEILKNHCKGNYGVMHCYSGSVDMAKRFLDLGFYISFCGPLTFKNDKKLKELAKIIPRDRAVIETDSPCLSPEPLRGRTNLPTNVCYIGQKLADIWEMSAEECANITRENSKRLFRITN